MLTRRDSWVLHMGPSWSDRAADELRHATNRRSSRPSMRRTKRFSSPSSLCDIHPRPIHLSQRGGTERFLQSDQGANENDLDSPSVPPIGGNVPRTHAILSG